MYVKGIEGRERSGFILLESILALALFAIVAVGFTVAIQQVAFTANSSGESMRVQRMLETLLTEASKVVRFEEVEEGIGEDEKGVYYSKIIEEIEMQNMDEQELQNMWRIAIIAEWEDASGRTMENVAEMIRYEPLYQNNR
ncbi:MAG: type II secretion system protein [Verrucomicrobiaceae bacterium]|nr:type II secretion system protein [Verrucomicrobiaceae bacterium]